MYIKFIHPFNICLLCALFHARNWEKSRACSGIYRKDLCSQGKSVITALKKIKQSKGVESTGSAILDGLTTQGRGGILAKFCMNQRSEVWVQRGWQMQRP